MNPIESFEPTEETCDAVQSFLEAVTDMQSWHTGETFFICRMCGEADSHTDDCPVPAVQAWQCGASVAVDMTDKLTRRMTAYYVLGATNPSLLAGGSAFATVRAQEIERIEAALHAAGQNDDAVDAKGRAVVLAIMRQDDDAASLRRQNGGW